MTPEEQLASGKVQGKAAEGGSKGAGGWKRQNFVPNTAVSPFPFCTRLPFLAGAAFSKAAVKRRLWSSTN